MEHSKELKQNFEDMQELEKKLAVLTAKTQA